MPKKQVVRRVAPPSLADFDEQWWPVTFLLLGAAGCIGAYVWYRGDFANPRPLANARSQLALLATTVVVLLLGLSMLRGRAQRRLQLGVFLSLLFHLGLLITTQRIYLALMPTPPQGIEDDLDDDVPVTLPDYLPTQESGQTTDDLTRPAETELRNEPKTEVTPQLPTPVDPEKESVQEPEPRKQTTPAPVELAKVELTAPRRNEVLSGAQLSRKELPDKLPTETVPDRQINAATQPELTTNAAKLEAERRESQESPTRRPTTNDRPTADRPQPDLAPFAPQRRPQEEQVTAIDLKAALERRTNDAALQRLETPGAASPAPKTVENVPQTASPATTAATGRRTPAAQQPIGSPANVASPTVTFTPNAATTAETARAETAEPSPSAVAALAPRKPSRIASGAASAGVEAVPFDAPAATAATTSNSAGGASLEATATAVRRGNQGTPQLTVETGMGLPSPLGSGSGTTPGGTTIGPRRDVTQGEAGAGVSAAAAVVGRPSTQRAAGPAAAPLSAVPVAAPVGVPGAANVAGNAPSGTAQALQPSASAVGVERGAGGGASGVALPAPPSSLGGTGSASAAGNGSGTATGVGGTLGSVARADVGTTPGAGTAVGRSSLAKLSPGQATVALPGAGTIDVPTTSPSTDAATRGGEPASPSMVAGAVGIRREAAGLPVLVTAPEGPGGLTTRPSADVGIPTRRARPESEVAHLEMNRLIPERIGGKKSGGGMVRDTAVVGLKQRDPTGRGDLAKSMGGSEESERAVEMGLDFLARHQSPDGSWRLHDFGQGRPEYADAGLADMESNTAGTGLALLAFLGAGYTHSDGKYAPVVEKGLAYLLRRQKPDGDLFVPPPNAAEANTWLYSHGIASIALCEALGMTRDDQLLKGPAQRAINFIAAAQNPELGGWRYLPRIGSDTSVSGWQLMALKSAERIGLDVPPQCYPLVTKWLDFAQGLNGDPTRYSYMPQSEFDHQRVVSRVMTAEALLMRQYLGWNRDHPNLTGGADYLLTQLPALGSPESPQRDSYYWYYATQVMFHMKGDHWRQWNERLRPLLVDAQETQGPLAGSWNPRGDVPDPWGGAGGRIYVTAMHLLMLEVYYRYLPLYQNLEE